MKEKPLSYASWRATTLPNGRVFYEGVERRCPDLLDHAERQRDGKTRHDDPVTFSCGHRHKAVRTALPCIVSITRLGVFPAVKIVDGGAKVL